MKKVYVAHPYRGKRSNIQSITDICLRLTKLGVIPISPVLAFRFLNDAVPEERRLGMTFCDEVIPLCDEIWFFSEWWNSVGCRREMNTAGIGETTIRIVTGWDGNKPIFRDGDEPEWSGRNEK